MSELAVIGVLVWLALDVTSFLAFRRRERWLSAHHYLQGYVAGVMHEREGLVVLEPDDADRSTLRRAPSWDRR